MKRPLGRGPQSAATRRLYPKIPPSCLLLPWRFWRRTASTESSRRTAAPPQCHGDSRRREAIPYRSKADMAMLANSAHGEIAMDRSLAPARTLAAAFWTGRRCCGVEIDPHQPELGLRHDAVIETDLVDHLASTEMHDRCSGKMHLPAARRTQRAMIRRGPGAGQRAKSAVPGMMRSSPCFWKE